MFTRLACHLRLVGVLRFSFLITLSSGSTPRARFNLQRWMTASLSGDIRRITMCVCARALLLFYVFIIVYHACVRAWWINVVCGVGCQCRSATRPKLYLSLWKSSSENLVRTNSRQREIWKYMVVFWVLLCLNCEGTYSKTMLDLVIALYILVLF